MFSRDDLQIVDPLTHIREHPETYLADGQVTATAIMCRILADVLVIPNCQVLVQRSGDWWVIGSDIDWIETVSKRVFHELVSFPQAGQNSFHGEVLLTAFARDVVLVNANGHTVVAGQSPADVQILELPKRHPYLKRIICFRMES